MKAFCISESKFSATAPYHKTGQQWDGETRITLFDLYFKLRDGSILKVPRGFITDLGSIPSWARGLVDDNDESTPGFIGHDYVVMRNCPVTMDREQCDEFLHDVIRDKGQSKWRSFKTWIGVKIGDITIDYFEKDIILDIEYIDKLREQMNKEAA